MAISILTSPPLLIMSKMPVVFTLQGSATDLPLRIAAGITAGDGDMMQADTDKKAVFELSDYLQGSISEIGKTGNAAELYSTIPLPVTFTFIEWVGDPPVNNYDVETSTYYLIDAYIPASRRKSFYALYASLKAYLTASHSALSWWPYQVIKTILPAQAEILNFMQLFHADPSMVKLYNKLYFTDGTSVDRGAYYSIANVPAHGIVYFPVGPVQLDIATYMSENYPDKTLEHYSVYAKVNSTVSPEYHYLIDENYYPATRILYIRNPYGLLEILTCRGLGQQDSGIKPAIAETDGDTLPDKIAWKTTREDVVKVNTGWLPSQAMPWLTDLLESTEAYEMISGVLHPIVFHDINIPVIHDGEYQFHADLEYEYTYTEKTEQA